MRLMMRCVRLAPLALILTILAGMAVSLRAQTFGEIVGEVRDPSGSVVAGADVKAVNKGTSAERSTVTNGDGLYSFPALQPGIYDVTVTKPGFQSISRTDFQLQVQQTARADFALQIGQATQQVSVTSTAALLTTENATVGSVIENKRIVELPLNGRNFLQLVLLTPNVTAGFSDSGPASQRLGGLRSQQNISIAGQRSEFNHYTLDGVEDTDPNFNSYVFLPSIDALQEFKVQSGIYPAEFGRAIGQVNVSTKSGTNQFHGALFEFLRNDKLDAKPYAFDQNRPPQNPFKWNQYGFTLGGPVWIPKVFNGRNKLFFFSNYDGYRDRKSLQTSYNVPNAAMRSGDFSALLPKIQLYDPATRVQTANGIIATPFANNRIPLGRFDAKSLQLLEFIPAPNVNTTSLVGNLQEGLRRVIDKDQFTQRIDYVESANSNWYGRYSWGSEVQTQASIFDSGTKISSEPRQEMISNSRIFSPTIVNEARFSHTGFANNLSTPFSNVRNVNGELNIPGLAPTPDAWGVPNMTIGQFSVFGDTGAGPYVQNNHMFQFVDNVSWSKGKHSLRFGVEFRRDRFNARGNSDPRGTFVFSGNATQNPSAAVGSTAGSGTAMADFLLGYVQNGQTAAALAFGKFRSTTQNYYIDDSWRVTSRLTVTLGLRYERTPPYRDESEKLINVQLPVGGINPGVINPANPSLTHPVLVRMGSGPIYADSGIVFNPAIQIVRDGRLGDTSGVQPDNNDFAPRLGIAFSPTDKWTIRTGIGIFYAQDIANLYFDMSRNLAGPRQVNSNNSFPNTLIDNPFSASTGQVQINTPSILAMQTDKRTPYVVQYTINVQRQLIKNTVLEVGYLGSESHKLESWVQFNEPLPSPLGTPTSRFPFPEFAPSYVMSGRGNANYQSLGMKLEHRLGDGLTAMASYTWSKSLDLSSGARAHGGEQQFPQTAYCLQCERGLSNFNVASRFVTSTLYQLPLGKGKRFLNHGGITNVILGGWQLSSILTLQTGTPLDVISGYDSSNRAQSTIPPDRPDATGATVAIPRGQQDPNLFFNTSAFFRAPLGTLGTVGRNTVIGPGVIDWDMSAIKDFQVRENQRLQFRFETFNLANHPNWGNPDTTLTDSGFGTIRSTRTDMRDMQVGLKYIF